MASVVMILAFLLLLLTFVLVCCVIGGSDPAERMISDREQMEFISKWKQQHPENTKIKQDYRPGR